MGQFIGRDRESRILSEAQHTSQAEFIAVMGRRRVGKTFLINRKYKGNISFQMTGLQHGTLGDQLQNMVYALGQQFPQHRLTERPTSWLAAFYELTVALSEHAGKGKQIVFFDELPWMATRRSKFINAFGWFWNSWANMRQIIVVICGSATSWIVEKILNDRGGLHNRITRRIHLQPFTLRETESFFRSRRIRLNHYQLAQLYMVMGGVPMYLEQVMPDKSALENIKEICFSDQGYLRNEYGRLFSSLFENHENYEQIIAVLASKKKGMTRSEIIEKTRFKNGGVLTKILNDLDLSGFIDILANFKKTKRDLIYRLTDPYSLFYIHFLKSLSRSSHVEFSSLSDLSSWRIWSGYAFENVCLKHIKQIRHSLSIGGVQSSISSFVAKPKDGLPGAQIDLLIDRGDQSINLCEIKFSTEEFALTKKIVENMATKVRVFRHHTKSNKNIFITFITTFGLSQNKYRINHVDQEIILSDLFAI